MSTNGSGNGHDPDHKNKKIVKFPTLGERDRMKREERQEEERWRKQYRKEQKVLRAANSEPFFKAGNIPPFTKALILAFLVVHIPLYLLYDPALRLSTFYQFGFMPGIYTGAYEWSWLALVTPLTHALIHGSWMHLAFNAVMGLVLGMFLEKMYGSRATAIFFAICTLCGALFCFALSPQSITPVIGASGGISGFFGALIYITITQNTNHPITQRFGKHGPWPILVFWGLFIVVPGLLMGGDSTSWQAHLGGYVGGIVLLIAMQKGKIRL